jgi:hypothetical protein
VCLYSGCLLIIRAAFCQLSSKSQLCSIPIEEESTLVMLGMISLVIIGLFSLFIAVMIHDQLKCISDNTTGIESLKKELIEKRPRIVNFEEAFGGKFSWKWFFPFSVKGDMNAYLISLNVV